MNELSAILSRWNARSDDMERAIADRNFLRLSISYRQGSDCFEHLQNMIQRQGREALTPYLDPIRTTLTRWQQLTTLMVPWMNEIKADISSTQHRKKTGTRLAGAYTGPTRKGIYLKVKAK